MRRGWIRGGLSDLSQWGRRAVRKRPILLAAGALAAGLAALGAVGAQPPPGGYRHPKGTPAAPAAPPTGIPALPPSTLPPFPGTGSDGMPAPGAAPTRPLTVPPTVTPAAAGALPGRVSQNVTIEAVCPDTIVYGQEFRYE